MWKSKKIAIIPIAFTGITWFFRETIKDIFFGLVGNKVISFFKDKDMIYILDLTFQYGVPVVCFVLALYLWFSSSGEKKTKPKPSKDFDSIQKAPEQLSTKVERDVWLLDAIHYIVFGSWDSLPENLEAENYLVVMDKAKQELQQNAFDGLLPVWGKGLMASTFRKIEPEVWEHNIIDLESLLKDEPEELKISMANIFGSATGFNHLMTSKAKVEELWHAPIKPELKPDMDMADAIYQVVNVLYPESDFDMRKTPKANKLILEKILSGELRIWGKDFEIDTGEHYPIERLLKTEEWKCRVLHPKAMLRSGDKEPQTESIGGGNKNNQFTGLRVNKKEVKKLWPLENT